MKIKYFYKMSLYIQSSQKEFSEISGTERLTETKLGTITLGHFKAQWSMVMYP